MSQESILKNISSKFILDSIFNYINDDNFKYRIFTYSKLFQKRLELDFTAYKEKYISQIGLDFDYYLSSDYNARKFNKDLLKNNLKKELLNYNISLDDDIIKIIIGCYFKKYIKSLKDYNLDIFSPFFDLLIKSEIIENFSIKIMLNKIQEYDLMDDYISLFDELNKIDSNYPALKFYYNSQDDLNFYFNEFNVNVGKINTLFLINEEEKDFQQGNFYFFFGNFFAIKDFETNLIHLELILNSSDDNKFVEFDPNLLEKLNDFKSLKHLKIKGFKFFSNFKFKLDFLENLEIINCKNISFNGNKFMNLKKLVLDNNTNLEIKSALKLPELEECELTVGGFDENFNSAIDYSSLKILKKCKVNSSDFLIFGDTLLDKLILNSNRDITSENEREILEKIISIKTLKDISFDLYRINNDEIANIKEENNTITKMEIINNSRSNDFTIYNLQNKFTKLNDLSININSIFGNKIKIEIEENPNSKVDKFSLTAKGNKNIKFYIKSFEELISANFNLRNEIINIKDAFPIFSNKCLAIFKYLTNFVFEYPNEISVDILNNIYNNIDKMPNLKYLKFYCISKNIDEELYKKFVKKIISLKLNKLNYVHFMIKKSQDNYRNTYYSLNELKELFPNINQNKLNKVYIRRFTYE